MFLRGLLAVTVLAFGVVVSAPLILEETTGPTAQSEQSSDSTLALAPISLGNPAAAATLNLQSPSLPRDDQEADLMPASLDHQTLTVGRGDTLAGLLTQAGVERSEAQAAIDALDKIYNARRIMPGQEITVTFSPLPKADPNDSKQDGDRNRLLRMALSLDYARDIAVERSTGDDFTASEVHRPLTRELAAAEGTINDSLYDDAVKAGVPVPVLMALIHTYSWDVDFQRDLRPGDHFEVVYERYLNEDGKPVHNGAIVYADLHLSGIQYPVYRFKGDDGSVEYFNDKGQSTRKALMRTPINGARLSSGYGRRKHPILGYTRMHRGIDFAAPTGTPIYAAGDGTIDYVGRNAGYGNYVRIRHNKEYSTAYGHMSRYAKGDRRGRRVKQGQIIGYVGATGLATGPHLHFEILVNGHQVNPLKVRMPSGRKLAGKELKRFLTVKAETDHKVAELEGGTGLAVASGD